MAITRVAGDFLRHLVAAVPYNVHTVLTDDPVLSDCRRQAVEGGIHLTTPGAGGGRAADRGGDPNNERFRAQLFELACAQNDVEHRLIKPRRPWTNGQVERINRTIEDATVNRLLLRQPRPAAAAPRRLRRRP